MKKVNSTKARQDRSVAAGRGRGEGDAYTSHIQITRNELASRGRSAYTPSLIASRHHDELSHLESKINLTLPLFRPIDVREGYRMELHGVEEEFADEFPYARGTVEIASALGYKHPTVEEGDYFLMTTDFVATKADFSTFTVNGKYEKDIEDRRTRELIRIEKFYWEDRGGRHYVATERHFDRKLVNNLEMMASFRPENVREMPGAWFALLGHVARSLPMRDALRVVSAESLNIMIDTVKHAVATGRIITDLHSARLRWDAIWPPLNDRGELTPWFGELASEE